MILLFHMLNELNLNQAEQGYKQVRNLFDKVKDYYSNYYSGLLGRFRRFLNKGRIIMEEDKEVLKFCLEALIPLAFVGANYESYQHQSGRDINETLFSKIGNLNVEILNYSESFKNRDETVEELHNRYIDYLRYKEQVPFHPNSTIDKRIRHFLK